METLQAAGMCMYMDIFPPFTCMWMHLYNMNAI